MGNTFAVAQDDAGQRLDLWLCKKLAPKSRKQVKVLLDSGQVVVNGKVVFIAGWELVPKDLVEVKSLEEAGQEFRFVKVLYEDADLIIVDKPWGIPSVPEEGKKRKSMQDLVFSYLRRRHKDAGSSYLKPLHRLDTDTSGVMAFSKSRAGEAISNLFRAHNIERKYLAVVCGRLDKNVGRIELPIEKGRFGGGKKGRPSTLRQGKQALTEYSVKERYSDATLVEINVKTGRTHQIRIHFANAGHPLVGDRVYGTGKHRFHRQALHATLLGFIHPASGKKMRWTAILPRDIKLLIETLRKDS